MRRQAMLVHCHARAALSSAIQSNVDGTFDPIRRQSLRGSVLCAGMDKNQCRSYRSASDAIMFGFLSGAPLDAQNFRPCRFAFLMQQYPRHYSGNWRQMLSKVAVAMIWFRQSDVVRRRRRGTGVDDEGVIQRTGILLSRLGHRRLAPAIVAVSTTIFVTLDGT